MSLQQASYTPSFGGLGITFIADKDQLDGLKQDEEASETTITFSYSTMGLNAQVNNYFVWRDGRFELEDSSEKIS